MMSTLCPKSWSKRTGSIKFSRFALITWATNTALWDSGLGTRDSGLGTRDSGLGTRDSGLGQCQPLNDIPRESITTSSYNRLQFEGFPLVATRCG